MFLMGHFTRKTSDLVVSNLLELSEIYTLSPWACLLQFAWFKG